MKDKSWLPVLVRLLVDTTDENAAYRSMIYFVSIHLLRVWMLGVAYRHLDESSFFVSLIKVVRLMGRMCYAVCHGLKVLMILWVLFSFFTFYEEEDDMHDFIKHLLVTCIYGQDLNRSNGKDSQSPRENARLTFTWTTGR